MFEWKYLESYGTDYPSLRDWSIVNNGFVDLRPLAMGSAAKEPSDIRDVTQQHEVERRWHTHDEVAQRGSTILRFLDQRLLELEQLARHRAHHGLIVHDQHPRAL